MSGVIALQCIGYKIQFPECDWEINATIFPLYPQNFAIGVLGSFYSTKCIPLPPTWSFTPLRSWSFLILFSKVNLINYI